MGQPSPGEEQPFIEPFTPRETDILALLAEGMSDREIADCLVVATSTVKWYNRQIYDKLGVSGREQVVERATTLGLLDTLEATTHWPHNLPAQTTPFIGREQELVQLADLLADPEVRLITILAPGGMGKTRLPKMMSPALKLSLVPVTSLGCPHSRMCNDSGSRCSSPT